MMAHFDATQMQAIEALFQAILSLETLEDCDAFFKDLCTRQELIALSQRLQVAKRLLQGDTYDAIRQELPVSSATITRINTALQFGAGGYQRILARLAQEDRETPH